jgi:CheY-like chemotaxis protein
VVWKLLFPSLQGDDLQQTVDSNVHGWARSRGRHREDKFSARFLGPHHGTQGGKRMEQLENRKTQKQVARERIISRMIRKSNIRRLKARILVVDDEPDIAETIQDLLLFAGFDAETAENGQAAVDLLNGTRRFDLMITDMRMPKMDGLELLKTSHQLRKHLPVVILTGYGTVDDGIHSLEEGAYDYILKPFNTEKLLRVVRGALRSRSIPIGRA